MDLFGFGNKITLETTDHGFCKVTVNRGRSTSYLLCKKSLTSNTTRDIINS